MADMFGKAGSDLAEEAISTAKGLVEGAPKEIAATLLNNRQWTVSEGRSGLNTIPADWVQYNVPLRMTGMDYHYKSAVVSYTRIKTSAAVKKLQGESEIAAPTKKLETTPTDATVLLTRYRTLLDNEFRGGSAYQKSKVRIVKLGTKDSKKADKLWEELDKELRGFIKGKLEPLQRSVGSLSPNEQVPAILGEIAAAHTRRLAQSGIVCSVCPVEFSWSTREIDTVAYEARVKYLKSQEQAKYTGELKKIHDEIRRDIDGFAGDTSSLGGEAAGRNQALAAQLGERVNRQTILRSQLTQAMEYLESTRTEDSLDPGDLEWPYGDEADNLIGRLFAREAPEWRKRCTQVNRINAQAKEGRTLFPKKVITNFSVGATKTFGGLSKNINYLNVNSNVLMSAKAFPGTGKVTAEFELKDTTKLGTKIELQDVAVGEVTFDATLGTCTGTGVIGRFIANHLEPV